MKIIILLIYILLYVQTYGSDLELDDRTQPFTIFKYDKILQSRNLDQLNAYLETAVIFADDQRDLYMLTLAFGTLEQFQLVYKLNPITEENYRLISDLLFRRYT